MNTLVVGVGTGRCGTKSLARLLKLQDHTFATHERFGPRVRWDCPPNLWPFRLWKDTKERDSKFVVDIAFYWTPHIETFLKWGEREDREVRIVGLKRDRTETVDSYDKWKPNSDHWSYHGYRQTQFDQWDHSYPYFETDSKREGIGKFWDYTYNIIEKWQEKDERVRLFNAFECFNEEGGVKSILEHCKYEDYKVETNIKVKAPKMEEEEEIEAGLLY